MFSPRGVYAAMLTPFDSKGQLNVPAIRKMIDSMVSAGIDGVFPVSNAGEHLFLTDIEKKRFVNTVIEQSNGKVKVTPGITSPGTDDAIAFAKYCKDAGADGVVLFAPYYYKYPQDVVYQCLQTTAGSIDLPVILYNIPLYANYISVQTFEKLLKTNNIVAIKDSSGSIFELLQFLEIAYKKEGFNVLVGWEEMLVSAMSVGAAGCMVASGCIFPEIMASMYQSIINGDANKAAFLVRIIANVNASLRSVYFPYGYRLAMEARGFDMGKQRVAINESIYAKERANIYTAVENALDEYNRFAEHPRFS